LNIFEIRVQDTHPQLIKNIRNNSSRFECKKQHLKNIFRQETPNSVRGAGGKCRIMLRMMILMMMMMMMTMMMMMMVMVMVMAVVRMMVLTMMMMMRMMVRRRRKMN